MTEESDRIERAARYLVALRRAGRPGARIPSDCRPDSIDAALAIQQRVADLLGASIGGWKCALPSAGNLVAAPIHTTTIVRSPACRLAPVDGMAPVEPEIAFTLGADLPPRATPYSAAEVGQAIGGIHLAFELIGARYAPDAAPDDAPTFPEKLADSLSNTGLLLGPALAVANKVGNEIADAAMLAAFELTLHGPQGVLGQWNGRHPDGHPFKPLYWLANFLNTRGTGLKHGDVVTTGSFHGLLMLPMSVPLTMQFGPLGTLAIEIAPAAVPAT